MSDHTLSDIHRLAVIVKPKDVNTFTVDVIAGVPSEEDVTGTSYYETTLAIGKSSLEGHEGIDALFEIAKQTMKELIDGKVVLNSQ